MADTAAAQPLLPRSCLSHHVGSMADMPRGSGGTAASAASATAMMTLMMHQSVCTVLRQPLRTLASCCLDNPELRRGTITRAF